MSEGWSADVGQAFTQAPHRTQRPRNSASGSAPGGRIASGAASAEEARIRGSSAAPASAAPTSWRRGRSTPPFGAGRGGEGPIA